MYRILDIGLTDYLLYYHKPFHIKVGDGQFNNLAMRILIASFMVIVLFSPILVQSGWNTDSGTASKRVNGRSHLTCIILIMGVLIPT